MKTKWFLFLFGLMVKAIEDYDPAANQIVMFRNKISHPVGILTTNAGASINHEDGSGTLNKRLIFHEFFMEYMTHFDRERTLPRVVHAKGAGGFGYFEVTHDIKDICKAKLFSEVGKRTPLAARFSPIVEEVGGIDTSRCARGFALKFYTEDGVFDIVGLNTPMFVVKDPLFFPTFARSRKNNPQTNLRDSNMFWDFLVVRPESMHIYMRIFSDLGIPDGYRHMPGFGVHTFQVVNEKGEPFFIRFHFIPDAGIKNLSSAEGLRLAAIDPDYAIRDLFNAIDKGNFPSWTVSIQVLTIDDVKHADFDVFDVTKVLPEENYPLRPVGRFVLNKNPVNYFADVEQLAFCPANLVPGILGAPDKLFEARRLSYRDTQYYRLGANFHKIDVNRPNFESFTYNRDGRPPVKDNEENIPNYYPNSYNGPVPYFEDNKCDLIEIFESSADNLEQTRELYYSMSKDEQSRVVENIVYSLSSVTDQSLMERSIKLLSVINKDLGTRVREGIWSNKTIYWD